MRQKNKVKRDILNVKRVEDREEEKRKSGEREKEGDRKGVGEKREERLMKKVKGEVDRNITEVMGGGGGVREERRGKT